MINTKMVYLNRIEICEGNHVNKTNASKECIACYYWYLVFLDKGFKFQPVFSLQ